jgi:hypothetical protein
MKLPDEIARALTVESLQKDEPRLRDMKVVVDKDATGDDAVFLTLVLDDAVPDDEMVAGFKGLRRKLHDHVWGGTDNALWPYVRCIRESDAAYEAQMVGPE